MADRWRSALVAGLAAVLLALPAGVAAKPQPKRACQAAKVKAKKIRCRAPQHSRGVERGHAAPAAIRDDDGRPATRAGRVLEI